jgi:signal transduction histidine kinase/CheY-like chemotaxis protein
MNQPNISIAFSSTHDDDTCNTESLTSRIKDNALRQDAMQQQGTGLPTVEDILTHRLKSACGKMDSLKWHSEAQKFCVRLNIVVTEQGKPAQPGKEETLKSVPIDQLIAQSKPPQKLKILIVEDQIYKFRAIQNYVEKILTGSIFIHTWDLETTCQLLIHKEFQCDMIILDMTLPVNPTIDADLKSLAGLTVLKVMALNQIHYPAIVMTQYTNWSAEASMNTRVFIEQLNRYCSKEYPAFYKGIIRFSHTELKWQDQLKDIIYDMSEKADHYSQQGDYTKAIEFYENEIQKNPDNCEVLYKLAHACHQTDNKYAAIERYNQVLTIDQKASQALEALALIYSEIGDIETSEIYFERFKQIHTDKAEPLRTKILQARLKNIEQKRQQLCQAEMMTSLGQMLSGMSHELSTPLQVIKTIAQSTEHFIKKGRIDQDTIITNLHRMVDAVNMMGHQIIHIQDLAKNDHLKTMSFNINEIIQRSFDFMTQQLKNHGIRINLFLDSKLPEIVASPNRMEQVFINLIQNSKDALLPVKDRKKEIIVRTNFTRGLNPVIQIHFEDNGTGIEPSKKHKIFDLFFTTKDPGKGMGIGLSIVNEIITESGGTIKILDESAGGVTFLINIPVRQKEN